VSYVVESGASRSRRARRRRALITLAVVALMLFFAFWYAYSYYRTDRDRTPTATPSCTTTTRTVAPGNVTLNVYNATNRNGLAARTATEVRKRGFKVASVANDPLQKTVDRTAEVRYGKSGTNGAKLVLALVKGSRAVLDARTDSSVDLVLGEKFTALAPVPKPTKPATTSSSTTASSSTTTAGC
jgi:hypothetical protein